MSAAFKDALILAHWESQSYNGELFVDLQDFCERLAARYPGQRSQPEKVTDEIRKLVRKSCYTGVENQFSNGVSIYFPWADVARRTKIWRSPRKPGWNDFLKAYVEQTRLKPRGFKDGAKLLSVSPATDHSSSSRLSWAVNDSEKRANVKPANEVHQSRPQYAQPASHRGERRVERVYSGNPVCC